MSESAVPDLADSLTWRGAVAVAREAQWTLQATGDWSWVYRSHDGRLAWRVTPFDPAFEVFAAMCATHPHELLPEVFARLAHQDGGHSTIMEWLDPVSTAEAERWLAMFESAQAGPEADLRRLLSATADDTQIPLFMGLDTNPANVMRRTRSGTLTFTDAFWINGVQLLEMLHDDPAVALSHYTADELAQFAYLPCMDAEETALILRRLGIERDNA